MYLDRTSPMVDAVPLGVHGCGSEPWGDWHGEPRPADGNDDGVLAYDIGPKEMQPPEEPPFPWVRSAQSEETAWGL